MINQNDKAKMSPISKAEHDKSKCHYRNQKHDKSKCHLYRNLNMINQNVTYIET